MKKIGRILKENQFLLLALSVVVVLCFGMFLLGIKPAALIQDQVVQYELFYEEWIGMVKKFLLTKELPFYSWNSFLGTDFFTTKSYYLTGDFFLPLYLLSPFSIRETLMGCSAILIFVSGLSMSIYLKKWGIQKASTRQIIGFCFALSGLATMYFSNFMFFRFYAILPLLFYGVEKYIQDQKLSFFTGIVAILFLQSYYFMFPTSLFLILYFFISVLLKEESSLLKILQKALPLIGAYLIGFLMSAVILVPTIWMMLHHPRVGSQEVGLFWNLKVLLGFLYSHITAPFNLYSDIPYIFVEGYNGHGYWYSIYASGLIFIAALQQFFFDWDQRRKKIIGVGYGILLLFIFIQPLNSIVHGFSEPSFRWMFLVVFYLCLSAAIAIDHDFYDKKKLVIPYAVYSVVLIGGTLLAMITKTISFPTHLIHVGVSGICLLWGWGIIFLLQKGKTKWVYRMTFVEVLTFTFAFCWILSNPSYNYKQNVTQEYVQYYQQIDEEIMYRQLLPREHLLPGTALNLNQSLPLGYMSISMYDTTYETNLAPFLKEAGFETHIVDIRDPEIMKMLGVKYVIAYDQSELANPEEFEYVYNLNHLQVYRSKEFQSIGFTYPTTTQNAQDIRWMEELLVPEKWSTLKLSPKREYFDVTQKTMNSLKGNLSLEELSILYLSVPYNPGWKIFDNGQEISYEKVQLGFIGILLEKGDHYIEMYYTPQGFKPGAILSFVGFLGFAGLIFLDQKKNKKKHESLPQ